MAEEHTYKASELESNVGGEGAVETKDRGLFDFMGKKEEEKPKEEAIATEFDKVKIEDTKAEEEGEEKMHGLLEKLHRSNSSSSSSSDEGEGEGGEKKKKKKKEKIEEKSGGEKKEDDTVVPVEKCDEAVIQPETPEKKGFLEKIKEKLPGQHKKAEEVSSPPPFPAAECVTAEPHHEGETKEKKGILEKIKEKLPGYHSKTDEEKEKEKD